MAGSVFVVVGGGHAGGRAVEALRAAGHSGAIHLVGAEPHLPYERPPLSKELLLDPSATLAPIRDAAWYAEQGVGLHLGDPGVGLDPGMRMLTLRSGQRLKYDKLLLATGGRVRHLTVPGSALAGVHYLRTVEDSRAVAAAIARGSAFAVVGGGFIGLEVAAAARSRGCAVTVIEATDRLMGRALPQEVAAVFADLHRERGVDIRFGIGIEAIEGGPAVSAVVTTAGDRIPCQTVVVGIGILPDTTLAEAAGLLVDDGVVVDAFARTSDAAIYAAGDATRHPNPFLGRTVRLESWQNAQNQAIAAARNMCGADEPFGEVPWFWSDQYGVNLQTLGDPICAGRTVIRGNLACCDGILFRFADGRLRGAVGIGRARDMRMVKRLMAVGTDPDPLVLADESVALRALV